MSDNLTAKISLHYFRTIMVLLGFAFPLSIAMTNIVFYLWGLGAIVFFAVAFRTDKALIKMIVSNRIFLLIAVWIIWLYLSLFYTEPSEQLANYIRKYLRYVPIFFFVFSLLAFYRRDVHLSKYFWQGFLVGTFTNFVLSTLHYWGGMDDFVHVGRFAQSLIFSVLFAYGLVLAVVHKHKIGYLLCLISLIVVFVFLQKRTGYITLISAVLWLVWYLTPNLKVRLIGVFGAIALIVLVFGTNNKVSVRMKTAFEEVAQCADTVTEHHDDIKQLATNCYSSSGLRLIFYTDAVRQIAQSPLLGSGMANLRISTLQHTDKGVVRGITTNPHNEYLLQGVQIGIAGIALIIALFAMTFFTALRLNDGKRVFYASMMVMYAASCLFNSFLLDAVESMLFITTVSFIIAGRLNDQHSVS